MKLEELISTYISSRTNLRLDDPNLDYSVVNDHIEFVKKIEKTTGMVGGLWDFNQQKILFLSDNFDKKYGFNPENLINEKQRFFLSRMHPTDAEILLNGSMFTWNYVLKLPVSERKDFELRYEYRIKNDHGKMIRITMSDAILELDRNGNFWINMKLIDIGQTQNMEIPGSILCINIKTGEPLFTDLHIKQQIFHIDISKREIEVLSLIAQGLRSKEIAEKLFISTNTVNNHRRNILSKMKTINTTEAINTLRMKGLM